MAASAYLQRLVNLLQELQTSQLGTVQEVAARMGQSIAAGGIVHLFGSGHSHMAAEEVFVRAGTLTTVRAIWPQQITDRFERVEGLGESVLKLGDVRSGEVLFVISNSGINPLPIDVALEARQRGAITVAVSSRAHSLSAPCRHSGGKRLFEVCDYFLDTGVPAGDAVLELSGLPYRIGPASTMASVALIQAAMAETVEWLLAHGYQPPVRISRNLPGGDAHNDALGERYRHRIPELA